MGCAAGAASAVAQLSNGRQVATAMLESLPVSRQIHQIPHIVDDEMVDALCFTWKATEH